MRWVILLALLLGLSSTASESQTAYQVCSAMEDEHDRLKCLEIVRDATRFFPEEIVSICETLERGSHRNRVLSAAKDRVFPSEALEVCSEFATDERIQTLLKCVETAGDYDPKKKKATSITDQVYVYNWSTYAKAINAAEANASQGCRGWAHYSFSDPNWKRNSCGSSEHAKSRIEYTIKWENRTTRRGTAYSAPVPVAYTVVDRYHTYHCRANYYCWKWVKDYSDVLGE